MAMPLPQSWTAEPLAPANPVWPRRVAASDQRSGRRHGFLGIAKDAGQSSLSLTPSLAARAVRRQRPEPTLAPVAGPGGSAVASAPAPRRSSAEGEEFDRRLTDLMVRFQNSREAADFEVLYAAGAEDVLQWIRSLLRQGGAQLDASELLQDTFVNVYRYPSGFRPEHAGSFRVWVRTIAGNAVRRARRRAAPRASALEEQTSEPCDPGASPLLLASGREQALVFARSLSLLYTATLFAFERLRPRDRRALELVELQGQPYAEAGPLLGVPPENMKMIVFRARRRLLLEIGAALSG
jgi:RNA polymerase sigma factor (sigma-70 family)